LAGGNVYYGGVRVGDVLAKGRVRKCEDEEENSRKLGTPNSM
jgi:hypothetical protein